MTPEQKREAIRTRNRELMEGRARPTLTTPVEVATSGATPPPQNFAAERILALAANGAVTMEALKPLVGPGKFAYTTIQQTLTRMAFEGRLVRVSRGVYELPSSENADA